MQSKRNVEFLNQKYFHADLKTPIGKLFCLATDSGISLLLFDDDKTFDFKKLKNNTEIKSQKNSTILKLEKQLEEYFVGRLSSFAIELDSNGTDFQLEVWNKLQTIPYGNTKTYAELAKGMGNIKKIRAVANANAQNTLLILIPCHRIIGTGNKLTGYRGGIERKRWLINFEKEHVVHSPKTTLF